MDDILIVGETDEEHDQNLEKAEIRMQELGIPINEDKSQRGVRSIEFLGHVLSKEGVRPAQDKLQAVKNFMQPTSKEELRSFVGFVTFLSRFIPHLSSMTEPLRELLKKEVDFEWRSSHAECFEKIKDVASEGRCLIAFNARRRTRLYTDASPSGLGAVLLQDDDGVWKPVAFASKGLTELERKYGQTEREALSLVWGCEKFSYYLLGRKFELLTDCKALKFIFSHKADPHARIERWALRLQPFDFELIHIDGTKNIADPFSRMIKVYDERPIENDLVLRTLICGGQGTHAMTLKQIREETPKDPELCQVLQALEEGNWSQVSETYKNIQHQLCDLDGLVLRGERIVIPKSMRDHIISMAHEGHPGAAKMKERIRPKMWFPQMESMVEKAVKNCKECVMTSLPNRPMPVKRRELPEAPWEAIAMDYKVVGKNMVLVVIDYYSRFIIYEIVEPATAKETAITLRKIFSKFGVPGSIQCDNGTHFLGEVETMCQEFAIKINRSAPHYPRANGEVERVNRELKRRIQIAVSQANDWRAAISDYVLMYHSTPHVALEGRTPAQVFLNRKIKDKLPEIGKRVHPEDESIRDADRLYKEKGRLRIDAKRRPVEPKLSVGDIVMTENFEKGGLIPNFGPQEFVISSMNDAEAVIDSTQSPRRQLRRHLTHLKKVPRHEDQEQGSDDQEQGEDAMEEIIEREEVVEQAGRENKRIRRQPEKFKDYQLTGKIK